MTHSEFFSVERGREFTTVLRGYDRDQVDALIRRAAEELASVNASARPTQNAALLAEMRRPSLAMRFRGYDREQVETHLRRLADHLESS
jgi:DivIVA domain-containing protein